MQNSFKGQHDNLNSIFGSKNYKNQKLVFDVILYSWIIESLYYTQQKPNKIIKFDMEIFNRSLLFYKIQFCQMKEVNRN